MGGILHFFLQIKMQNQSDYFPGYTQLSIPR